MQYLCICQQPDNSDLLKGVGPASQKGGAYELSCQYVCVFVWRLKFRGGRRGEFRSVKLQCVGIDPKNE